MKKTLTALVISLFCSAFLNAQSIRGNLSKLIKQPIKLEGFDGLKTYPISSSTIDEKGNFSLTYTKSDYGVGYLMSADDKPLFVILSGEDMELVGETLSYPESIKVTKGQENQWFEQYAQEHPRREQALSAWVYLEKIYLLDSLFSVQERPASSIQTEKQRIKAEDAAFLAKLPKERYVSWFLPTRKLVSSVSTVAQYRSEEIPATITAFRNLDYTDQRLYKSGLFKDAIESHFWLLENCGKSLDSMFIEMQYSIDAMMVKLVKDEKKLNEVTDFLFDLLERHSLFQASEHLALEVLNQTSCTIATDLANKLETYRTMKKGNIAPDLVFNGEILAPGYTGSVIPKKLSELKSNYTLVVFGASWCPKCTEEIPLLANNFAKWKQQDIEVVYVSLDVDEQQFKSFASIFPFVSVCDYQKWESEAVRSYHVFATPTMYLLDERREILLRPTSVGHLEAWVAWNLVQGNK
ncbi:MAG: thiol-disulfide isomerase/thioredoxin [Spirosomataceae bacterium]|jgi:thiol-disulfide isomerase/thioredoxin